MLTSARQTAPAVATTTAGLRGTLWNPDRLPADARFTVHPLKTSDGASVVGFLMARGGESTVVCAMHPRELTVPQYMAAEVLQGGCAFWIQGSRTPNNDLRLEHETALLDLAAGQAFLRSNGFVKTVLQGTSGGGPLATFYCQQSALDGHARISKTPAGRPVKLPEADLPAPDGLLLISSHLGQGPLLQNCLDPSVTDEGDPFSVNPDFDPFDPRNGFNEPPQSSAYAPEFVERYRTAQVERSRRIDAKAKELLAHKAESRKRIKAGTETRADKAMAAWSPTITIWRTDADLRCYDLSIEASDRAYGSLWGANPYQSNYGSIGFARICTPESWLSNWSAAHSNATMRKCAPDVRQPTCVVQYTGDNSVYESEASSLYDWLGAPDKSRHRISGNHHGQPVRSGASNGQLQAGEVVREWLSSRGFTAKA